MQTIEGNLTWSGAAQPYLFEPGIKKDNALTVNVSNSCDLLGESITVNSISIDVIGVN